MAPPPELELDSELAAALEGASWAVAAFAPEDALWVDWLYRNLNGYPVPGPLTGQATAHGLPRPDCLSIFPDRRDPQHAEFYPLALEKSGYLVVVCSPHAARCPAVEAQICAFKNAGGEERIIALIVEGEPAGALESMPRSAAPEWLPAWLRWRLTGDAFAEADRGEPRIVDARPGRTSLKEVRDLLLATLLDVDAWELEVLGCLARPVEVMRPAPRPGPPPPPAPRAVVAAPVAPAPARKVGPVVLTAALCVSVTLVTAWWSFTPREMLEPASVESPAPGIARQTPPPPAAEPEPLIEETPAPAPPEAGFVAPPPAPAAPQLAAVLVFTNTLPVPPEPPDDGAARVAQVALHQRGDAAVHQRRLDEALGYYEEAVDTALVVGPRASAEARAEAALLCRKLATLQLQMASTSEAKASFIQGRKLLLQLKKQGAWNSDRAKLLAEIETGLRHLPRD